MKTAHFLKHNYNLIMSYMIHARQHSLTTNKCYTVVLSGTGTDILFIVTDTPERVDPGLYQIIYQAYNPYFDVSMYLHHDSDWDNFLRLTCGVHLCDIVPRSILRNYHTNDVFYYITQKYPYMMEQIMLTIAAIETDYLDLCNHLTTIINDLEYN